jgi:drug/metabolite transporter (DMT)-like permease
MPFTAIAFIIAAAAMHTAWNLIVKRAGQRQTVTWWALIVGVLANLPLLLGESIPAEVWPYAIASAAVEAAYFMLLIRAYENGDFSEVYPIARGAAPVFIAVWAVLFLGERPQAAGLAGLGLLLVGLMVVGASRLMTGRRAVSVNASLLVTMLTVALCISVYSAIDAGAVRLMRPAAYNVLVMGLTALFIAPFVIARYGVGVVAREGRANLSRIVIVGVLLLLAYMLVLEAYSMARASYVGALREISVVMAALVGWRLMDEGFGVARTAGAVLIFCGIVVVALAG